MRFIISWEVNMVNNKVLRSISKWFIIYFACILLIQLCNPLIIDTEKYFQGFNANLNFNQFIWLILCVLVGIFCFLNRIINIKVVSIFMAVYCTFRFYEELHPEWSFMQYRSIYYLDILVGVLFFSALIESIKEMLQIITWRYKRIKKQKENTNNQEYKASATYSDNSITRKEDDRFGFYEEAKIFLDKLEEHKVSYQEHALIVGLEGEWGSGKSSFINMIECAISNNNKNSNFKLIKFSSWNYRNPNQLTVELLFAISEAIGVKEITKAIDKYIKVFEGTSFQWLAELTRAFCGGVRTTQEYFNDVNEKLKFRDQTLIIAVDDIDRLVKEETLEVLKLLRNTANFRNIVYVVAYDRKYVEETLKEYGINDSEKYLEKIFNVPFLLPEKSIEQRKELYKEILQKNILFNKTDKIDKGIEAFINDFGEYISIRNVKKLSKQLLINTPFLRKDGLTFELDIYDTLILYYLSIEYKPIYENLKSFYCNVKNLEQYKRELIYCNCGVIKKNMIGDSKEDENEDFYIKRRIFPILKKQDDSIIVSKFITRLFATNNKGYDKTAYCMSNPDVYPIFFSKKIPENYVKTKDFIDESKKASFSEKLNEWNEHKNRTMLRWVISCLRYEDYNEDEFITMFKSVISEVTIKGYYNSNTANVHTDKILNIIPGLDCKYNLTSENYRNTIKKVLENIEYNSTFCQRFALLIYPWVYERIYEKQNDIYIGICESYVDVYLKNNSTFHNFNYDFWDIIRRLYNATHDYNSCIRLQEQCKKHILANIGNFALCWDKEINKVYLSNIFSIPHNIVEDAKGGWEKGFFEFLEEHKNDIDKTVVLSLQK